MPNPILDEERLERAARACAKANGDDYDHMPASKSEWNEKRGQFNGRFRDVNEPFKTDYQDMAESVLSAYLGETHVVVPREPTSEHLDAMLRAGQSAGFHWSVNVIDKLRAVYRSTLSSPDKIGEGKTAECQDSTSTLNAETE